MIMLTESFVFSIYKLKNDKTVIRHEFDSCTIQSVCTSHSARRALCKEMNLKGHLRLALRNNMMIYIEYYVQRLWQATLF